MIECTAGTLLGGRVRYRQPRDGYRTGIEPVLLAAAVPAQAGETVLEGGTGAGAGLLCLRSRVPGVRGTGIEIDPAMAALARSNVGANGFEGLCVRVGDVTRDALPRSDHAMANPPWHDPGSTAPGRPRERLAKQEADGVEAWVGALGRCVRYGGSVTLIVSARLAARASAAFGRAGLGGGVRCAMLPKAGRAAKIVLLQGWRGAVSEATTTEVALHEEDGRYTAPVEAVLREGAALAVGTR